MRQFVKVIPDDVVALIRAIINMDLRERRRAGYIQGTNHLAERLAAQFGLNIHTVRAIKERKRRRNVEAARLFQKFATVPIEQLEKIRQRRIRSGVKVAPLDRAPWHWYRGHWTARERMRRIGTYPTRQPKE